MKPAYIALVLLTALTAALPMGSAEAFQEPLTRPIADVTPSTGVLPLDADPALADAKKANLSISNEDAHIEFGANITMDGLDPDAGTMQSTIVETPYLPSGTPEMAVGAVASAGLLVLLWNLLRSLGWAWLAPLFSRIDKNELLENDIRGKVREAIAQNPGISLREIQKTLGIAWGTAVYHVQRLEDARIIVSTRIRQFRCFYLNGSGLVPEDKTAAAELRNETTRQLAMAIRDQPGVIQQQLCQRVGIRPPVAHKHLARLEKANLLTRQKTDGTVQYYPTERLGAWTAASTVAASSPVPVTAVPA